MTTIRKLAETTLAWHKHRVDQLQLIVDTPASTEIRLGEGDDAIVLTGDKAVGFRSGIIVALSMFRDLPFSIDTSDPLDTIETQVIAIVANQLGLKPDEVKPESSLRDDLGADSLDEVEMIMGAEEYFSIDLTDDAYAPIKTVQQAIDVVRTALAETN